jgi:hypothetical protein
MPNRYNEHITIVKDAIEAIAIIMTTFLILVKPYLAMGAGIMSYWLWYQRNTSKRLSGLLTMLLIAFVLTNILTPILNDRIGKDLTSVALFLIGIGNYKLLDLIIINFDNILKWVLKKFNK